MSIATEVLLVLALKFLHKVGDETVVEALTTKVSDASSGIHLEDTLLNSRKRGVEGSATEIEDKDILLPSNMLLVETIGNSGGGGFADDAKNLETSDPTSILGCLTLGISGRGRPSWRASISMVV